MSLCTLRLRLPSYSALMVILILDLIISRCFLLTFFHTAENKPFDLFLGPVQTKPGLAVNTKLLCYLGCPFSLPEAATFLKPVPGFEINLRTLPLQIHLNRNWACCFAGTQPPHG